MITGPLSQMKDMIGGITLPTLGREVDIPVYLIHEGQGPDDYYFIFDFEQFVERSRSGIFVRPKLKIWSGRPDFNRRRGARLLREAFAREFDAARHQLEGNKSSGWFSWTFGPLDLAELAAALTTNVILLIALGMGRLVFGQLQLPHWMQKKSEAEQLEASIAETQAKVDSALEKVEVTLHMDLYRHAWRGRRGGPLSGMDYEAWPLPASIAQHLDIGG